MTSGIFIEGLVIVLLAATIVYCYVLSGKLKSLKLEENALRLTIAELMTATELAERAINGLKVTSHENLKHLGVHVREAEKLNVELRANLSEGEELVHRIATITQAGSINKPLPSPRRAVSRPTTSQPRAVSELAAEATARINALRRSGS
ncbi:MAG: DUF6468 domain-containing protein [Hyphomicrobiales bacterium]